MLQKTVNNSGPTPIRAQVRSILIEEIGEGLHLPGERIPSERSLAERYRASRASIREAIAELISEGILFRTGGRGTFVSEARPLEKRLTGGSQQIGFWISEEIFHFVQSGFNQILTGVEEVCRSHGVSLNFHSENHDRQSMDKLLDKLLDEGGLAGNIVAGGVHPSLLDRLKGLGPPVVLVDTILKKDVAGIDRVRIDYAQGTRLAVKHLAELGHREIGFIGFAGSERYETFWQVLEELGLPYLPRFTQFLQISDLAPGILSGYQCMTKLISQGRLPTALVVVNDYVAEGALQALSISGLSVPEDVSVVGYDDLGQNTVPLTSVRVDIVETGRVAARTLFERLQRLDRAPREVVVPVELVVRRSTGVVGLIPSNSSSDNLSSKSSLKELG